LAFRLRLPADLLVRAALDSLIQLNENVDVEPLLPHWNSYPDETVILLAAAPGKDQQVLLSLAGEPAPYARWVALSNLLAETRAPGFAALLLRELTIRVTFFVSDDGMGIGFSRGVGGGASACGVLQVPVDYPPIAVYELTMSPATGHRVVAPGRTVVYAERKVAYPPRGMGRCADGLPRSSDEERMHYLAKLLDASVEALPLQKRSSHAITFQIPGGFLEAVGATVRNTRARFALLVGQLQAAEMLTAAEAATLSPRIAVEVHDARADRSVLLPAVSGVETR
jgi:hypothetical protein